MRDWIKKIKVKHFFTEKEDYQSLVDCMANIKEVLYKHTEFKNHMDWNKWDNLPKDNEWCTSVEAANKMIGKMYDIAHAYRIWVE